LLQVNRRQNLMFPLKIREIEGERGQGGPVQALQHREEYRTLKKPNHSIPTKEAKQSWSHKA
jgi:hypothetical protein